MPRVRIQPMKRGPARTASTIASRPAARTRVICRPQARRSRPRPLLRPRPSCSSATTRSSRIERDPFTSTTSPGRIHATMSESPASRSAMCRPSLPRPGRVSANASETIHHGRRQGTHADQTREPRRRRHRRRSPDDTDDSPGPVPACRPAPRPDALSRRVPAAPGRQGPARVAVGLAL